ncbi:MAG TPA: RNA polymerase sigma factor [Actinomycetota bacterium]|nr:RNA polymerase sigma factor [Actinomycetota bacterium]
MHPPFQQVLDDHAGDVLRFLTAICGRLEAEDCFQETMVAALRAYPDLTDSSNLRAWLLTIAHRKAIDAARRRARAPVPVAAVPDRAAATDDAVGEVWTLVGRLPPKQKGAVFLRFAGGLPYREIGAVLDCSEPAARRSVHEGLKALREEWKP